MFVIFEIWFGPIIDKIDEAIDSKIAVITENKNGFKKTSIRKNYYNDVDGILMEKELIV